MCPKDQSWFETSRVLNARRRTIQSCDVSAKFLTCRREKQKHRLHENDRIRRVLFRFVLFPMYPLRVSAGEEIYERIILLFPCSLLEFTSATRPRLGPSALARKTSPQRSHADYYCCVACRKEKGSKKKRRLEFDFRRKVGKGVGDKRTGNRGR